MPGRAGQCGRQSADIIHFGKYMTETGLFQARNVNGTLRISPFFGQTTPAGEMIMTSVRERERQLRLARVDHEDREELGLFRLAGIGADGVAVAGQLGEALS